MDKNQKRALGRGLSALLESTSTDITSPSNIGDSKVAGAIAFLSVTQIETNPFQPRTDFDEEALAELAQSIQEHGIIQPITVRKLGYDRYQLISGERRFRATQILGLKEIPAYIRIANDQAMLEMALVENIQREDLNAIEVALSFKRLIQECDLTQEALSEKVGKNRTTVTNYLRLLRLPAEIQLALKNFLISMGHARALINIEDEEIVMYLFKKIISDGLSVRQTELLANQNKKTKIVQKQKKYLSIQEEKVKTDLADYLNTNIHISKSSKGGGNISISFKNDSELRRIAELLKF